MIKNLFFLPGRECSRRKFWMILKKRQELKLFIQTLIQMKPCLRSFPWQRAATMISWSQMTIFWKLRSRKDLQRSLTRILWRISKISTHYIRDSSMIQTMNTQFLTEQASRWSFMIRNRWILISKDIKTSGIRLLRTALHWLQTIVWSMVSPSFPWARAWMKRTLTWSRRQERSFWNLLRMYVWSRMTIHRMHFSTEKQVLHFFIPLR